MSNKKLVANSNPLKYAAQFYFSGNYNRCLEECDIWLTKRGNDPRLLGLKASALKALGRHNEAAKYFELSLSLNNQQADVLHNFAGLLQINGNLKKAIFCSLNAAKISGSSDHLCRAGTIYFELCDYEKSQIFFDESLKANSNNVSAMLGLARLAKHRSSRSTYYNLCEQAYSLEPLNSEVLQTYAQMLFDKVELEKSETICRELISIKCRSTETEKYNKLAGTLILGRILESKGDIDGAVKYYQDCIKLSKIETAPYSLISKSCRDKNIAKNMIKLIHENCTSQKTFDLTQKYFSLSNFHHTLGEYDKSEVYLAKANNTKAVMCPSNFKKFKGEVTAHASTPAELTKRQNETNIQRVFIVGLPRCGSTLLETILSMNKETLDLGEIGAINVCIRELKHAIENNIGISNTDWDSVYSKNLGKEQIGVKTTLDKNLANFMKVPYILNFMPNARIIHCKRHPLDHILSMLRANLVSGSDYTCNPLASAKALILQEDTMNTFKQKYPDNITTVDYDALVSNPEEHIRSVINDLGWDWNDSYLAPEKSKRTVSTASVIQVRQPINTKSLGGWKNYPRILENARKLLAESGRYNNYNFDL